VGAKLRELFWAEGAAGVPSAVNLAAIDLGTNSFHMVVVRATRQGSFQVLDQAKEEASAQTSVAQRTSCSSALLRCCTPSCAASSC
jgi:hypothetical protein